MKKLLFVFAVVFAIVLVAGCKARKNETVEFDTGDTTTVVTTIGDEAKEPLTAKTVSGDTASANVAAAAAGSSATLTSVDNLPYVGAPLAIPIAFALMANLGILAWRRRY